MLSSLQLICMVGAVIQDVWINLYIFYVGNEQVNQQTNQTMGIINHTHTSDLVVYSPSNIASIAIHLTGN